MRSWMVAASGVMTAGACWHHPPSSAVVESRLDSMHAEERPFRELAQSIPGHGGYFYDRDIGRPVLYLKNLGDSSAAIRLVWPRFAHMVSSSRPILIRRATYTWLQLKQWRDSLLTNVFSIPDVYSLDLDEARNRVVIGIDSTADVVAIRRMVQRLRIPQKAVEFEESGPLELH